MNESIPERFAAWLNQPLPLLINGQWQAAASGPDALTSGTFETSQRTVTMSVYRDRAEVAAARSNRRKLTKATSLDSRSTVQTWDAPAPIKRRLWQFRKNQTKRRF